VGRVPALLLAIVLGWIRVYSFIAQGDADGSDPATECRGAPDDQQVMQSGGRSVESTSTETR
jgi:hypothetical protein